MDVVSALVCTRNRAACIAHAVESLLDDDHGDRLEVIVVDQSDGPDTEQALRPWLSDPRLAYRRSTTRGKGAALNEGIRAARGSVVVCTDDDCTVPRGWAVDMAQALTERPKAAIVFCNVVPVPHDCNAGYVPAYERTTDRLLRSIAAMRDGLGLGAAMAVRKEFALSVGGFDESFGPGGRLPSADEWDLAIRALLLGWEVYETPSLSVLHDGFRSFTEGRKHTERDWIALGAVLAKPLRAGHLRAAVVPLWFFPTRALLPPLADAVRLRKPRGLVRISSFLRGFAEGLRTPVDRKTLQFERR